MENVDPVPDKGGFRDVVAIFHCSFHPTKGNSVDWSRSIDPVINLDGVEFSALPSGLHALDEDVIHFTKDGFHGICLFRREQTGDDGMRGCHQRSIGLLVAHSPRPRPWRHVPHLRQLFRIPSINGQDSSPLDQYFEESSAPSTTLDDDSWSTWEQDYSDSTILDQPSSQVTRYVQSFGPFFFTMYKHVLGGRRVLLYTEPPVQPACVLAQVAADLCLVPKSPQSPVTLTLGLITLNDIDRLRKDIHAGWIACTTDRVFFDKTDLYDMIIDLSPRSQRPTIYVTNRPRRWYEPGKERPKLHHARFTWSDVAFWHELNRYLHVDLHEKDSEQKDDQPRWPDVFAIYDDACILLARCWLPSSRTAAPSETAATSFRETVLSSFQWRTSFLLSTLDQITAGAQSPDSSTMTFPPTVLSNFELGPLSSLDAQFLEWLGERNGRRIEIQRSWRDLVSAALGLSS